MDSQEFMRWIPKSAEKFWLQLQATYTKKALNPANVASCNQINIIGLIWSR